MMFEEIVVHVDGHVAAVTLNRPKTRNAMSDAMQSELIGALRELDRDPTVRVVIITGSGDAFSAGGDLRTMTPKAEATSMPGPFDRRLQLKRLQEMILAIRACEKPVLAAVNGAAVGGGCDLALMCDIRFASDRATFGEVFARIGLFPGTGGTYLLPRTVGTAKALELIWTGDVIDATEAARIGLVDRVVPHAELQSVVMSFAERLAEGPPLAQALAKAAVYRGLDVDLATALDFAATAEAITLASDDHQEGVTAFLERRQPRFRGR